MRAIVLQHEELEGPGMLKPALEKAGFRLERRFREVLPGDAEADLVVVMGGPMSAYETDAHPYLADEIELLAQRLREGKPSLGICLGAQLLASAAGARVYPGARGFELGVHPVQLTEEARREPLFAALPAQWPVVHWHGDTFDAVPGAVALARSEQYEQQAFRVRNGWGFQFHPELDADTLVRWLAETPQDLARAGKTGQQILRSEVPSLRSAEPLNLQFLQALAAHLSKIRR